jgi:DNA-binding NtrC family response regulator
MRPGTGKQIEGLDAAALQMMLHYGWPGNVRELDHTMERALLMTRSERIQVGDLGLHGKSGGPRRVWMS